MSVLVLYHTVVSTAEARNCIVPTLVSHLMSHMEHMMPRSNFNPQHRANQDCVTCVAKLLELLSDQELCVSAQDVNMVVPLLHPLLRMCKHIPRTNSLAVSVEVGYHSTVRLTCVSFLCQPLNIVNFIGLLDIMHDDHYATYFKSLSSSANNELKV